MHKSAAIVTGALVAVVGGLLVTRARAETVTGRLIDLACYSLNKEHTENAHPGKGLICAQACAREGFAVGLLTAEGKVYQVAGGLAAANNAKLVSHMAHTVTITGDLSEKDGTSVIAASDLKMVSK
jgi:hypothetical protein